VSQKVKAKTSETQILWMFYGMFTANVANERKISLQKLLSEGFRYRNMG